MDPIYFEDHYIFDLSYFEFFYAELRSNSKGGKIKVNQQMDRLC